MRNKGFDQIVLIAVMGTLVLGVPAGWSADPGVTAEGSWNGKVIEVLQFKDIEILDALEIISQKGNINIVAGQAIKGKVSIYLKDVKFEDALRIILDSNDLAYKIEDGIVRVMTAKEYEGRYGVKFGGRVETKMCPLAHTVVTDVVPFLDQVKGAKGKIIPDLKSNSLVLIDSPQNIKAMERLIKKIDIPVRTEVFDLTYAKAEDIADKVRDQLTERIGQLHADDRSNKLVVTDTVMTIDRIRKYLKAVDVKEPQVLIEAKIIQVLLSDEHKFGVDWTAVVSKYHDLEFMGDFDILSSNEKRGTMSIGTLATDDYTVLLEALESVGESNILSSPRITALNNMEAKILVGSTEPYVTSTTTTTASGPTTTSESVNFIEVGVKLYVTPTIHRDGFITMKIRPEVSSVTSTVTTSNNNTIPVVDTSEAETTVTVRDGVTIIIGGLIKEEEIMATKKVPLLGDVPVLGFAFRSKSNLTRKTEVVIFLTPRIVTGDVPASLMEPLGLAPLEAMACATPVVAVKEGGLRETIRNGKNGFLTQRKTGRYARAIEKLLVDEERARAVGEHGRKIVESDWSWEGCNDRLEKNLLDFVEKKGICPAPPQQHSTEKQGR